MAPPLEHRFMDASNDRRLIVKAADAARRAAWFEWRYHKRGFGNLVSDALWTALQDANVRGWQAHYAYPDHIEV